MRFVYSASAIGAVLLCTAACGSDILSPVRHSGAGSRPGPFAGDDPGGPDGANDDGSTPEDGGSDTPGSDTPDSPAHPPVSCLPHPIDPFANAFCSCSDTRLGGGIDVAPARNGHRARVALNGSLHMNGAGSIDTSVIAGTGLLAMGSLRIDGSLHTNGPLQTGGIMTTSGNLDVGGNLTAPNIEVQERLSVGGEVTAIGSVIAGERAAYVGDVSAPCECDAGFLDVAVLVQSHADNNDNERVTLAQQVASGHLGLPTGAYYVTAAELEASTIEATGDVNLFVHGRITDTRIFARLTITAGSRLSLYLDDGVQTLSGVALAGNHETSSLRLFLGGRASMELAGALTLRGSIYAPEVDVTAGGHVTLTGALFVRSLVAGGGLTLGSTTGCGDGPMFP